MTCKVDYPTKVLVQARNSLIALFCLAFLSDTSFANWTLNLGYHNPPVANFGVNLLYFSNPWAFEIGLGWVDAEANSEDDEDLETSTDEDDEDSIEVRAAGAFNLKYFLSNGGIKPYIQGGFGLGIGAKTGDDSSLGAGVGGGYAGIGLFLGSPKFYAYGSINAGRGSNTFTQLGIGFDI